MRISLERSDLQLKLVAMFDGATIEEFKERGRVSQNRRNDPAYERELATLDLPICLKLSADGKTARLDTTQGMYKGSREQMEMVKAVN